MEIHKPKHNIHDNIHEIRRTGYPNKELLSEVTKRVQGIDVSTDDVKQIGKTLIFYDVKKFIHSVLQKSIRLPIWKIVIPRLDGGSGAIYYVACGKDHNSIFRGTFGYGGTGPHESALIEAAFESFNLNFEVRDGDYLLGFLEV